MTILLMAIDIAEAISTVMVLTLDKIAAAIIMMKRISLSKRQAWVDGRTWANELFPGGAWLEMCWFLLCCSSLM